jgi:hypothetical protein
MSDKPVFPLFAFQRDHDLEVKDGYILAGRLLLKDEHELLAGEIVQLLLETPAKNSLTIGWGGDGRPPNAADVHDDEVMAAWAKDCIKIEVRVDPRRDDGCVRIPMDILGPKPVRS